MKTANAVFMFFALSFCSAIYAAEIKFTAMSITPDPHRYVYAGSSNTILGLKVELPVKPGPTIDSIKIVFSTDSYRYIEDEISWYYSLNADLSSAVKKQSKNFESDKRSVKFTNDLDLMDYPVYMCFKYKLKYEGLKDTTALNCVIEEIGDIVISADTPGWEVRFSDPDMLDSPGSDFIQVVASKYKSILSDTALPYYDLSSAKNSFNAGSQFFVNMFCLDEYNNIDSDGFLALHMGETVLLTPSNNVPEAAPNGTPQYFERTHGWEAQDNGVYAFPVILYAAYDGNILRYDGGGIYESGFTAPFSISSSEASSYKALYNGVEQISTQKAGIPFTVELTVLDNWKNIVYGYEGSTVRAAGMPEYANESFDGYSWIAAVDRGQKTIPVTLYTAGANRRIKILDSRWSEPAVISPEFNVMNADFKEVGFSVLKSSVNVLERVALGVTAMDTCGNSYPDYNGVVELDVFKDNRLLYSKEINIIKGEYYSAEGLFFTDPGIYDVSVSNSFKSVYVSPVKVELEFNGNIFVGQPLPVKVKILGYDNQLCVNFGGQVKFESSDTKAVLPNICSIPEGEKIFEKGFNFTTPGEHSLSASVLYGSSLLVFAQSAGAIVSVELDNRLDSFEIITPEKVEAEKPFGITIKALDAYGNHIAKWSGEIRIGAYAGSVWLADKDLPVNLLNIYSAPPGGRPAQTYMAGGFWSGDICVSAESVKNGIIVEAEGVKTLQTQFFKQDILYEDKSMNYPNPFNPLRQNTTIRYFLDSDSDVDIKIFTLTGGEVKSWSFGAGSENGSAGLNFLRWDGKDGGGNLLASGGYLCSIWKSGSASGGVVFSKKKSDIIKIGIILDR